jgi:hypothetical protein
MFLYLLSCFILNFLLISFIILWQLYYVVLACIFHTTVYELAALLSDDLTLARILNKWVCFLLFLPNNTRLFMTWCHDLQLTFSLFLNLVYLNNVQVCKNLVNCRFELYFCRIRKINFVINRLKLWTANCHELVYNNESCGPGAYPRGLGTTLKFWTTPRPSWCSFAPDAALQNIFIGIH